ncbi:acyl-CoA carboxylase subunit epsilon [Granulicoccus sp. GXG6511]|uniref:acyl-CoA carboxylase subunit epsilon n=1 Tax=Granulicoccus sp. GXG6511 TaxID=3381351 RepID=UPI003D7C41F4
MSDSVSHPPVVTVVSGSPTAEELAAIVTVLTAAAASPADGPEVRRSDRPRVGGWRSYTRVLRGAAYPGPGAWRDIDH